MSARKRLRPDPENVRRKQILVSDMDETLVHYYEDISAEYRAALENIPELRSRLYRVSVADISTPTGTGEVEELLCLERPYLHEFLTYVKKRFRHFVVWSAGKRKYVDANVKRFSMRTHSPVTVWAREECTGDMLLKPLANLVHYLPDMSLANTFIIDDRFTAFSESNLDNGILVRPYAPTVNELIHNHLHNIPEDNELLRLIQYFERPDVLASEDVRKLDKEIAPYDEALIGGMVPQIDNPRGDGDCLFSVFSAAVNEHEMTRIAASAMLEARYVRNPAFGSLVRRYVGGNDIVSPPVLRGVVVAEYSANPKLIDRYISDARAALAEGETDFQWLVPALRGDKDHDRTHFLRLMSDRGSYWGDQVAIDFLTRALSLVAVVHDQHGAVQYVAGDAETAILTVHLVLHQEHFSRVVFRAAVPGHNTPSAGVVHGRK